MADYNMAQPTALGSHILGFLGNALNLLVCNFKAKQFQAHSTYQEIQE